jgi:hypothetical protein
MDSMLNALTTTSSPLALLLAEVFQKMTEIAHDILIQSKSEGVTTRPCLTISQPLMLRGPQPISLEVFHHEDLPSVMMT